MILALVVHPANIQDRDGARLVIKKLKGAFPRLKKIWADGGYRGQLIGWVKKFGGWVLEIVERDPETVGFAVLPRRWVVERTLAWLGRYRRMSKDYEMLPESSETMVYVSMINLMIHRLVKG